MVKEIGADGGVAQAARVDALDETAVERHLDDVITFAGHVDISFNAIGIPQQGIQGIPLIELAVNSFALPLKHVRNVAIHHSTRRRPQDDRATIGCDPDAYARARSSWSHARWWHGAGVGSDGAPVARFYPQNSRLRVCDRSSCEQLACRRPRRSTSCSTCTPSPWA